jgi:hypothetical protein
MHHAIRTIARSAARTAICATGAAALLSLSPAAAPAAQYSVDACQHPDGALAGRDGWRAGASGSYLSARDECATGGGLVASWDSSVSHAKNESASWVFDAPKGTTLATLGAARTSSVGTDQQYGSPVASIATDQGELEACTRALGCSSLSGTVSLDLHGAAWVRAAVYCAGAAGCAPGGTTAITLRRVRLTLNDATSPSFAGAPSGTLLSADAVSRLRSLNYSAVDTGGGVYRHRLLADDREDLAGVVDDNGGACAQYATSGAFTHAVPCKTSAAGAIAFDTATLADGRHELRLEVVDATDVNKVGYGPWPILVDNLPPAVRDVAVTGTPRSGDLLTATATVDGQSASVSYQWLRAAADGSGREAIAGATGATYRLTDEDVGRKVLVAVTATDHGGTTTVTTQPADAPFTGRVVGDFCENRPTGAQDECGDLDLDGRRNRVDDDIDGDGVANAADSAPYDATTPAKPASTTPDPPVTATPSSVHTGSGSDAAPVLNPKDPAAVAVANPQRTPGANGSPADAAAVVSVQLEQGSRTGGRAVAGFAERVRIRGTITTQDGRPIADAHLHLVERDAGVPDAAWRITGGTVSRPDGSILLFTRQGGRSRDLRLVYFPQGGRDGNRASNPLALLVRQDARLALSRRVLRNGQTLRFRGTVHGDGAAAVQLQVRLATGWFTFKRLTTGPSAGGRFTARYTFRRTTRTTRYRFRVRVLPRSGARYAIGYSRTTSALVRP